MLNHSYIFKLQRHTKKEEYSKLSSNVVKKTKDTITNIDSIIDSSSVTSTAKSLTL